MESDIEISRRSFKFYLFNEVVQHLDQIQNLDDLFDDFSHSIYLHKREE